MQKYKDIDKDIEINIYKDMDINVDVDVDICCICLDANTCKSIKMPCCRNGIHAECLFEILVSSSPILKKCALCRTDINKDVFSVEQIMLILDSGNSIEKTNIYVNTYLKSPSVVSIHSLSSVSTVSSITSTLLTTNNIKSNVLLLICLSILVIVMLGFCMIMFKGF